MGAGVSQDLHMCDVRNQHAALSAFLAVRSRKIVYISEVYSANVPDCKHANFSCQTLPPLYAARLVESRRVLVLGLPPKER